MFINASIAENPNRLYTTLEVGKIISRLKNEMYAEFISNFVIVLSFSLLAD